MKDHRFIELVNLYIDRQISADETAELEAEIQDNPRRRSVYRQYCQMHRATTLVYDSFRTQASDQTAASAIRSPIVRLGDDRRARTHRWALYAGGLAAAACFAFVVTRLDTRPAAAGGTLAGVAPVNPPQARLPQPAAVAQTAVARPSLVSLANSTDETDYAELIATLRQDEQRNGRLNSRLPSLFDDGVFESRQFFPAASQRTFRSRQTPAQQAEFTAFQFQR